MQRNITKNKKREDFNSSFQSNMLKVFGATLENTRSQLLITNNNIASGPLNLANEFIAVVPKLMLKDHQTQLSYYDDIIHNIQHNPVKYTDGAQPLETARDNQRDQIITSLNDFTLHHKSVIDDYHMETMETEIDRLSSRVSALSFMEGAQANREAMLAKDISLGPDEMAARLARIANKHPAITEGQVSEIRKVLRLSPDVHLSLEQYHVLFHVWSHLREKSNDDIPMHLIIQGGPGTGKTYVVGQISKLSRCKMLMTAVGGSAASNLPGGKTLCNLLALNPNVKTKNPASRQELPQLLSTDAKYAMLADLLQNKEHIPSILVTDEHSMRHIFYLVHVSDRMAQFPTCPENTNLHFGGHHTIDLGDWNQIPAIGESIPKSLFTQIITPQKLNGPGNELILRGCEIFKVYYLFISFLCYFYLFIYFFLCY